MGFAAFLAFLGEGSPSFRYTRSGEKFDAVDIKKFNYENVAPVVKEWIAAHSGIFVLIMMGLILFTALVVIFLWLNSRGKFVFLDNVVKGEGRITEPWNAYAKEGNSLFRWRLVYGIVVLFIAGTYAFFFTLQIITILSQDIAVFPNLLWSVAVSLAMISVLAYIRFFINHFIVVIMYVKRVSATAAWGIFLRILYQRFWAILVFSILMLLLSIGFFIGILLIGLLTCCIGYVLLLIPYVKNVFLLPVEVWFRSISLYFLGELDPAYRILDPVLTTPESPERTA